MPTYKLSLLKAQVYRAMTNYMTKSLEVYQLTPPDWSLVGILYERESMQPTELAQYLHVKPPVVTASLRRLQDKKIIKKTQQHKDNRFTSVSLTQRGREIVEKAEKQMQKDLAAFLKGIKRNDINTYMKVLNQISDKLVER